MKAFMGELRAPVELTTARKPFHGPDFAKHATISCISFHPTYLTWLISYKATDPFPTYPQIHRLFIIHFFPGFPSRSWWHIWFVHHIWGIVTRSSTQSTGYIQRISLQIVYTDPALHRLCFLSITHSRFPNLRQESPGSVPRSTFNSFCPFLYINPQIASTGYSWWTPAFFKTRNIVSYQNTSTPWWELSLSWA